MNRIMFIAAVLMFITVFVHIFMGGPEIYYPMLAIVDPDLLHAFVSVLWHAVTVVLICITGALVYLSYRPNQALAVTVSAIQIGFAGLFIYYGLTELGSLSPMPQWSIFIIIPAITLWGGCTKP